MIQTDAAHLQKDDWSSTLAAHLHEVCGLDGGFGKQHSVISNNPNWKAVDVSEATYNGSSEAFLELDEAGAIDNPLNNTTRSTEILEQSGSGC